MIKQINSEIIVVRSLTDSDLGWFAARRPTTASKQRALNINASAAQQLLSDKILQKGEAIIHCCVVYRDVIVNSERHIGKIGKNWRLGGNKIEGKIFKEVDTSDFVLLRTTERNDGADLFTILILSRAADRVSHARVSRLVEPTIKNSVGVYRENSAGFEQLSDLFRGINGRSNLTPHSLNGSSLPSIPRINPDEKTKKEIKDRIRSSHILEQMLKVSGDLSAPAQASFIETIEILSGQLRQALLISNRIVKLEKDHASQWSKVKGMKIGFVDGGLANLSMLGSAPIAARVGGYVVTPGNNTADREKFIELKKLINELYTSDSGVYDGSFPDIGALRDAARISIEAAGAVRIATELPDMKFLFLHGALVNPVSRYTDIMKNEQPAFRFPNFSNESIRDLLSITGNTPTGKEANFINIYLSQLNALQECNAAVCGVIEREASTSSVIRETLNSLEDQLIYPVLPMPPAEWKAWFKRNIDPTDDDSIAGQRITDSLLFRLTLESGEALVPVAVDRNEISRAPDAWKDTIIRYPKPLVSYLKTTEWSSPIRLEIFEKDRDAFRSIANLVYHCSLLLPQYSFPVGLDIVDRYAKIPSWMSKPINTNTAVQALKHALDSGNQVQFDALRRMMCGSSREWLLRPGLLK